MYECTICHRMYSRTHDLIRHKRNKHTFKPSLSVIEEAPQEQEEGRSINERMGEYSAENDPLTKLLHPFTMLAVGPTFCGKTTWIHELLKRRETMIAPYPGRIIWFYRRWQPSYAMMKRELPVEFIQGIPSDIQRDNYCDVNVPTLFIIDDLMRDVTESGDICELFTEGCHHRNLSVICVLQNLYYKGKETRTMSLNSHYMVLFKNPRDQQQVSILARQMYPGAVKHFIQEYKKATENPYSYLFVDLKQVTPEGERLKTNIFKDETSTGQEQPGECKDPFYVDPVHSSNSNQTEDMASNKADSYCIECGVIFLSPWDVQRHMKRGCPGISDNDDNDDHENPKKRQKVEETDDSAFIELVNEAYDTLDDRYQEKVAKAMEGGASKTVAEHEVSQMLKTDYRKCLTKAYGKLLNFYHQLESCPTHRRVIENLEKHADNGKSYDQAVKMSLRENKHLIDDLLESENNDTDSEEENKKQTMSSDDESA